MDTLKELKKELKIGCKKRPKRWEGDCHYDFSGSVDEEATNALMKRTIEVIETFELRLQNLEARRNICDHCHSIYDIDYMDF